MKTKNYKKLGNISGDFYEIEDILNIYKKISKKKYLLKVDKNTLNDNSDASKEIRKRIKLYKSWGYKNNNTSFYQIFDDKYKKTLKKLSSLFNLKKTVSSIIVQQPGNTLPYHKDTFINFKLKNNLNLNNKNVVRYMIFLDDRKHGHNFEVENEIIKNWKKGDIIYWGDNYHMGNNAGSSFKATLNITGISSRNSLHNSKIKKLKL